MNLKVLVYIQFLAIGSYAQAVIKGTVLDDKTNQLLPYASVYINYTTIGTNSDDKGHFQLTLSPGTHDLVVSFVGYHPYESTITLVDGEVIDLLIRLRVRPMKEIQIKSNRDAQWDKQLERFNKLFLGTGRNAKLCRIINPWVVTFPETAKEVFAAQATGVLEIENLSLGYRISYELKNFAVMNNNFLVAGYVRFQELQTNDSAVVKTWTANRRDAYDGSVRHFLKSVTQHCVEEEQFDIYEDRSGLKEIVRISNFQANLDKTIFAYSMANRIFPGPRAYTYKVQLPSRLEIHYQGKNVNSTIYSNVPFPVSWIEVKESIIVGDDGLALNPLKMTVLGAMFESRVADLLPNNYEPERHVAIYQNPLEHKPLSKLAYLTERPYLQTDKSYYYAGEIVWFKGYMNYFSRALKDSLSHVLHVDMVDEEGNVVSDSRFPIINNTIIGDFSIPSHIAGGDYTLRAYTRWMLNFDPGYSFKKPIKILGPGEVVKTRDYTPNVTANTITLTTDKPHYEPREKITLSVEIRDAYEKNIPANLSISVTDLTHAVPAPNEISIANNFDLPVLSLPDTLDKRTRFAIQHGFDLKGRFIGKKPKQSTGLLRFVQELADIEFLISTEEDGSFYVPNLLIYDTARLSVVAQTMKGKPGTVVFDSIELRPPNGIAEPLQIETYISEKRLRQYMPDSSSATILDLITIKRTRIDKKSATVVVPDFEVSGDWMRESLAADVLSALQMKVPGLRVLIKYDATGLPVKYLLLGGISSFGSTKTQEPLVLIDNIVVNDMIGGAAAQIELLSPAEIDRVEVSKFGNNAAYGARGGNGIISIHTVRNRLAKRSALGTYDKTMLKPVPVKGYSVVRKFISPDYSIPEKNIATPDYRTTIYWNSSIQTNQEPVSVSFFAADSSTKYRIVVEGVTNEGKAVRGEKTITIGKP